jgi:hypothetical protein
MSVKTVVSQRVSRDDPSSGDSSSRDDDFVIAPRSRKETRNQLNEVKQVPPKLMKKLQIGLKVVLSVKQEKQGKAS